MVAPVARVAARFEAAALKVIEPAPIEKRVARWLEASLIDSTTAERIRAFETAEDVPQKARWPVLVAVSFGGLMVGAGVLLFVASHWNSLSPASRFTLVLLLVAVFHVAGAFLRERFSVLATTLHALGTAALGAAIFLSAQIFNLQEHWPGGLMLWAAGAWAGWWLCRDWPQAAFAALLTPAWLAGEWEVATRDFRGSSYILAQGLLVLALTYLSARTAEKGGSPRRAVMTIGWLALLPCTGAVLSIPWTWSPQQSHISPSLLALGWLGIFGLPLLLAFWMRGRAGWMNVAAAAWVALLGTTVLHQFQPGSLPHQWNKLGPYIWCGIGSVGLVAWGFYEARKERINLGFAAFGLTVVAFYFSDVIDKLGRSASLVGAGVVFLLGGWALERTRRRLIARLGGGK